MASSPCTDVQKGLEQMYSLEKVVLKVRDGSFNYTADPDGPTFFKI